MDDVRIFFTLIFVRGTDDDVRLYIFLGWNSLANSPPAAIELLGLSEA